MAKVQRVERRRKYHESWFCQTEIFPRDSSLKDKFIKHFTGPVTFSSECSKHFHRLYHNTRDCSTPAYYKRCARLLTRLAMSPLCTQS
ncbi:PREDICTED: protein FAM150A [Cariama cristata]|uniref:protein FAM150A n=1 Tax=Cariama cristata TaxID=54380 RepID=UPI0005205EB2|nr:PREDICTED: protein FAM150A [Cariama cristata]